MAKGGGAVSLESYGAAVLRIARGIIFRMHAYCALFELGPRGAVAMQR